MKEKIYYWVKKELVCVLKKEKMKQKINISGE